MSKSKEKKQNCWEFMGCGREKAGSQVKGFGICPAAQTGEGNGVNNGEKRGRVCWSVAGTFCDDSIKGTFAKEFHTCLECPFYKKIVEEEGNDFEMLLPIDETG